MNYLGVRLRELREKKGLLLRQVAAQLDIDTALLSKIERGERRPQKEVVQKVSLILGIKPDELITLWLADKVNDVIEDEPMAAHALKLITKK